MTNDYGTLVEPGTIRYIRHLPGPLERVWRYLTEPELRGTWIGKTPIPHEVGGTFRIAWDGGYMEGTVRVFDPPSVLEYSWVQQTSPDGPVLDSVVRFDLVPDGDGVRLTLTHSALPREEYEMIGAGWHAHLDVLAARLADRSTDSADDIFARVQSAYAELAKPMSLAKIAAAAGIFAVLTSNAVDAQTTGHVTGIGGVFVRSTDPKKLSAWYRDMLGIPVEAWGGAVFRSDAPNHPSIAIWNPFGEKSDYAAPSTRDVMINFAVDDLDALVARLQKNGVTILKRDDSDPNGKFAWILDPEGTKLELWQPKAK